MRALVTGSHGFAGTHLRAALHARGATIVGLGRDPGEPGPGERYEVLELSDLEAVRAAVTAADPEVVFHLAADPGRGGASAARAAITSNVTATEHLCRALAERGCAARFLHVGSSAQYGGVPESCDPVDESAPLVPLDAYGWSKAASESIALGYHATGCLEVVAARPFNHAGPGEPAHLVAASFARQIAAIEAGADPVLHVGDLSPVRDFTDVRDLVAGYVALAEHGAPGRAYNLCSGCGVRIEDLLGMLLDKSEVTIEVRADPEKLRPVQLMRQVGTAARAERETGWTPRIPLDDSLDAVLAEWRERLGVPTSKGGRR